MLKLNFTPLHRSDICRNFKTSSFICRCQLSCLSLLSLFPFSSEPAVRWAHQGSCCTSHPCRFSATLVPVSWCQGGCYCKAYIVMLFPSLLPLKQHFLTASHSPPRQTAFARLSRKRMSCQHKIKEAIHIQCHAPSLIKNVLSSLCTRVTTSQWPCIQSINFSWAKKKKTHWPDISISDNTFIRVQRWFLLFTK